MTGDPEGSADMVLKRSYPEMEPIKLISEDNISELKQTLDPKWIDGQTDSHIIFVKGFHTFINNLTQ
jgi:hypothetical protein